MVICYTANWKPWPSRNSGFTQLHSMVDLSSSCFVNELTGWPGLPLRGDGITHHRPAAPSRRCRSCLALRFDRSRDRSKECQDSVSRVRWSSPLAPMAWAWVPQESNIDLISYIIYHISYIIYTYIYIHIYIYMCHYIMRDPVPLWVQLEVKVIPHWSLSSYPQMAFPHCQRCFQEVIPKSS